MKSLDMYPEAKFLDIGANVGMYTVMVAAMKRQVVAADPVLKNLALINSSLKKSNTSQYVTLVNNPISNEEELVYTINKWPTNPGATQLVPAHLMTDDLQQYIIGVPVHSVTLNHLIQFADAKEIILKIDVEGFECKILTPYLEKTVPNVFIPLIFMEFIHIQNNLDNNCPDFKYMTDLLIDSGYKAWNMKEEFNITKNDIIVDILW